ncbi:MAG: shikimate dehydrogenase [Candidatus Aenigmarchaeota archaeon]|nr:shikimate dehydrogenase [Candidatus Aenigmarchaeota archaeon]
MPSSMYGLVGQNIGKSPSQHMFVSAFAALGINASYMIFEPNSIDDLKDFVHGFAGFNVTIPFKESVLEVIDGTDRVAGEIGAVNVVKRNGDMLQGYNTDWIAAVESLKSKTPVLQKKVAIIGAGGAARAIAYGLRGVSDVTIFNRTQERAESLARIFKCSAGKLDEMKGGWDIVVNCTPASDFLPFPASSLANAFVFDMSYRKTKLLETAESAGCRAMDGKEMLARQASLAFGIWTGKKIGWEYMLEKASEALK